MTNNDREELARVRSDVATLENTGRKMAVSRFLLRIIDQQDARIKEFWEAFKEMVEADDGATRKGILEIMEADDDM
jgi:hypothetical protein